VRYILSIVILSGGLSAYAQANKTKIAEGNKAYDRKDYTAAEKSYREALTKHKNDYNANFNLGDALYQQKKYQEAVNQYQQAQAIGKGKNNLEETAYNTGNALLKANKIDESIEAYKKALKANPDDLNAKYNLSYALAKKKKQEQEKEKQQQDKKDKKDQQAKKNNGNPAPQPNPGGNDNARPDQPGEITKAEAERLLNALQNDEQKIRQRIYKNGPEDKRNKDENDKPW
jgi:tetratricopeptide (TPR) repeat protein